MDIDHVHHLTDSDLPDYVRKYCRDVKKRYVLQPVLPESDWPPTLGGQFIRLALIKQGRDTGDFKHRTVVELQKDYVRGKYDKILEHKTEIRLEEIFEPIFCNGGYEVTLKMLIDGAPGVGKTTLSRKVSQNWANGELLQEYWLVLLLHLRERTISKAQVIDDFFYHDDQMVQNATITFIKGISGKGVLIIFDGFDELSLTQRQEQSLFLDIIKGKVLSECAVVVTSRPYASRPVQELESVNRHIEVLGFTDEQIEKCIKQRINDKAKAEELCTELKDRLDIASICQIPLNCSIVLYVYKMEDYRLPDTLTELYELFILHGLRRYATRNSVTKTLHDIHRLPSPIENHFSVLSRVAYDGLTEDKLVFEQWDLELAFVSSQGFSGTDLPLLDLMTSAKSYSSRGPHDTYSFLHLTIQEYLCAFWAAVNLPDSEKLEFIRKHVRNERFYMVLWFFAGITKLNIFDVESIFNNDLWEYDNHVHICHLLYESQSIKHSLYNYVANTCISNKQLDFVSTKTRTMLHPYGSKRRIYKYHRAQQRKYSRFDCLMIAHFIAHSNCQWNSLLLSLDDVQLFHKGFNGLEPCHTTIEQVTIEVHRHTISHFHEGTITLLNEIPQFSNIKLKIVLVDLSVARTTFPTIKNNFKNVLLKTSVIKSIYMEILGRNKPTVTTNFYDILIEGIAHSTSPIRNVALETLTIENFEYLFKLLIKWKSNLKLEVLSISRNNTPYCSEIKRIHEFCELISTFLSGDVPVSLKKISLSLPFYDSELMSCTVTDTIQSGLDQNSTLEELIINKKIVFQRNKHTSKLELIKHHEIRDDPNQIAAVSEIFSVVSQTHCKTRDSEPPCLSDDLDSFQVPPRKQQKLGNSSKGRTIPVEVQLAQFNPRQLMGAAFSHSHLPTYSSSCPPSYYSSPKYATNVYPQLQHSFLIGSSAGETYPLFSRNYQILPQRQDDCQHQDWKNTQTHVPHRLGSTSTFKLPPMGLIPPTRMPNQRYPMPYQQQNHGFIPQYHVNSSSNYHRLTTPHYHPHLHTGTNFPQRFTTPPVLPHTIPFTSQPEQYPPVTAPPN